MQSAAFSLFVQRLDTGVILPLQCKHKPEIVAELKGEIATTLGL
jgi:hypothetical protein